MKRWVPFLIPFAAIVAAGLGAALILGWGPGPCGDYQAVGVGFIDPVVSACVELEGTAHYGAVVRQTQLGGLLGDDVHWYLFPLLPEGDLDGREVNVLVRTTREPERLVSFETMALAGRVVRATPDLVPYATEIQLGKAGGYFFTDDLVVITPDEVTSEGETWVASP